MGFTRTLVLAIAFLTLAAAVTPAQEPNSKAAELEQSAAAAQAQGDAKTAFELYVAAVQALDEGTPELSAKLRTEVIEAAHKLKAPPELPEEAEKRMVYGRQAVKQAQNPGDFIEAAAQFEQAARAAPWWGEAYFNLGVAQEKAGQMNRAMDSYRLYLKASPRAKDAGEVKKKLYALEYSLQSRKKSWAGDWVLAGDFKMARYIGTPQNTSGVEPGARFCLRITAVSPSGEITAQSGPYDNYKDNCDQGMPISWTGKAVKDELALTMNEVAPYKPSSIRTVTPREGSLEITWNGESYAAKLHFSFDMVDRVGFKKFPESLAYDYAGAAQKQEEPR